MSFDEPDESLYLVPAEDIHGFDAAARGRADDHLRWYGWWQRKQADTDAEYQIKLAKLQDWYQQRTQAIERKRVFHAGILRNFHRAMLERDPKHNKTISLPSGTLKSRTTTKPTVTVTDSKAFLDWCMARAASGLVHERPQPVKARVDQWVHNTGEIPDGAVVAPPGTSFSVVLDDGLEP